MYTMCGRMTRRGDNRCVQFSHRGGAGMGVMTGYTPPRWHRIQTGSCDCAMSGRTVDRSRSETASYVLGTVTRSRAQRSCSPARSTSSRWTSVGRPRRSSPGIGYGFMSPEATSRATTAALNTGGVFGEETSAQVATNTVFYDTSRPPRVVLPVMYGWLRSPGSRQLLQRC